MRLPLPEILQRWRLCVLDLLVITAAWLWVGMRGLGAGRAGLPLVLALVAWGLGLTLAGNYRAKSLAKGSRLSLIVDHLLISTFWLIGIWLCRVRLNLGSAVGFVVVAFAGLWAASFLMTLKWPSIRLPDIGKQLARISDRIARVKRIGKFLQVKPIPRTFFLGVAVAMVVMSLFGRWAAREHFHKEFTRVTPWIAPSTQYYPTVSELANVARQKTRPETVQVIVGGNSVFYGVGQPPDRVWTDSLQQQLGPNYSVVNLALPGAAPVDGGAVIAEMLRTEFPKQIYLANTWPCDGSGSSGNPAYRYIFWNAYYDNFLIDDPLRNASVARLLAQHNPHESFVERRSTWALDGLFHFQDGWNYLAYKKFGTVWGHYAPGEIGLKPRELLPEPVGDFLAEPTSRRFSGYYDAGDLAIIRGRNAWAFEPVANGSKLAANALAWGEFGRNIDEMFPRALRKRTLIMISRDCPYFTEKLSPEEREQDDLACALTVRKWREYGYESMDYGRDFSIEDYGDRVHLTSLGGEKLAKLIAVKVRDMSERLGYLKPAK